MYLLVHQLILRGYYGKTAFDIDSIDEATLKEMTSVPSFWKIVKTEFKHDKAAILALSILVIIFAVIIIGGFVLDTETVMKVSLRDKFSVPGKNSCSAPTSAGGLFCLS